MGQERKVEAGGENLGERSAPESRRHRPTSDLRFTKATPPVAFDPTRFPASLLPPGTLTDELRAWLWQVVDTTLFGARDAADRWTAQLGRPALKRVWTSPPIGGEPDRMPEDVAQILEGWFSLVEPSDVYAFLESVHDSLEPPLQPRFATAINAVLERGLSDHRFVMKRLMPIASKADVSAIDRAIASCKAARWSDVESLLCEALARLGAKPEPDTRGAIQEAVRAVQSASFALTKEPYFDLEDALQDLEKRGHVDKPLKAAYAGLFLYVTGARKTTVDDARLIVVMCASFVSHLAARV
ncbi:MAG: hypothetical protein KF850_28120 [Labilithrix sp.]|nr:hypothetical protein [Labilithrix sp.]